ncbi:uncharacterized protein LOC121561831 [Xyrichtys novacula]|uniref:Uncharacterized protein LOC121561831 n=1 Tax=Xyrichtys novacula TaxID=13765 RepID=A0AAV1FUK2_XYRNO|nr:uncharacterized protein LOC121561831 [Xyrichtys novacula]
MPLKVFHAYSRLLRFDDRESRPARRATDKLAAYIPSKPAKYGIKTWVACDSKSSYAWKMQVYTGKAADADAAAGHGPEKNLGMRVVLDVTEGLRDRNVTCDNFFTSYELGQQLLKRNMTMVGTVRKNKPELPPALLSPKGRAVFSSKFAFTSTTAAVSYVPKKNKNVLLVSTKHTEAEVSDRRDRKPVIILDYNRCKGGVDNLDKRSCRGYCKLGVVASDTYDCLTSNSAYADSASRSEIVSPSPTSIRPDNTVSVNDVDYCEKASDEREEGSRRSDERRAARDFYRDADSPRSRYEYDNYRSDAAKLDVGGRFGEDEAWENNPDEERDRYGWLSRRRVENYIIVENMEHRPYGDSLVTPGDAEDTAEADLPRNSVADWRELFDRSDERRTPRDWEGTSDRDADFYRDSNSPWSRREYDDYRSDAAELEVEGRFGEDEAWRNTPDVEGTSDRDADFYRDSDGPRSRRQYDDYRSDAAELEVEGRFGEDEAWRNAPDEEYDCRGLLSERHVEGDVVEDEECYPYGDSLGTPGDGEDTGEADLPRDGFMDRSELLNDEICIALWDCEEEVREEFGSNDRYAATCRWTELEESWKSFVGWLGERWWGSVSEESVRTFMDSSERRRVGDIVVSACFGDTPGGVCSFTVKTESGLLPLPLLIRRRRYVCADLAEGDFSCPIDILRKLSRETYTHLLPRPTTIPSDPQSFSLTRVVDDMWSVLELVKSGWSDVSRPHRIIQYLQNKEGPSVTPAALICCVDDDSLGYLFEIIDAKGKSLKVTFDKWGFTFGSGLHFSGLTSLLSHIYAKAGNFASDDDFICAHHTIDYNTTLFYG